MKQKTRASLQSCPKILAPAGDFIALQAALAAGADEIYFGIKGLNMRAGAKNFSLQDMKTIAAQCHARGAKALLALNTIVYEHEERMVAKILRAAKSAGIDAVIAWDQSVIQECVARKIPVHLSTQNSISNYASLAFAKKNIRTLRRVVLARECNLKDIKSIIAKIRKNRLNVEIEVFIHGAMCIAVSGRCFMSHELFNKSANRGECLQPCRRKYTVTLHDREEQHAIELGDDYVMSPKDLCTIDFIDQLIDAGIEVFKIEGRNRSPEYVATTVEEYRRIIEYYLAHRAEIKRNADARRAFTALKKSARMQLETVYHRGFSSGFYLGKPVDEYTKEYGSSAAEKKDYVGKIINYYAKPGVALVKIESTSIAAGDAVMIQGTTTGVFRQKLGTVLHDAVAVPKAVKGMEVSFKTEKLARKNDLVYKISRR